MDKSGDILRPLGPLPGNALYSKLEPIFASLRSHAHANGYAISKETTTATRQVYKCSKGGNYRPKGKLYDTESSARRKSSGSMKTGCPFRVVAHRTPCGQWQVRVHNGDHNHSAVTAVTASHKHQRVVLAPEVQSDIRVMIALGTKPSTILQAVRLKHRDAEVVAKDIYNIQYSYRTKQFAGIKATQWLLDVRLPTLYDE